MFLMPPAPASAPSLGDAVVFDGTNDLITLDDYGTSDQRANWIITFWVKMNEDGTMQQFHYGTGSTFELSRFADNTVNINTYGPGGSGWRNVLLSNTTLTVSDGWTWVGICCNGTSSGSFMFFNDTNVTTMPRESTSSEDNSIGGIVGGQTGTSYRLNADMFNFYIHMDGYMDFSVEANRRKFISNTGEPVDLGADGSEPTGAAPTAYYALVPGADPDTFAEGKGAGGDATITGAFTRAATTPQAVRTQILQSAGTAIGDMTAGGGLAAAFDGVNPQAYAACSQEHSSATQYIGKNWGSTKTITGFKAWASSDNGYCSLSGRTMTVTLIGHTSDSPGDGTALGSIGPTTDANNLLMQKLSGITTTTAYQYHWLKFVQSAGSSASVAEVQFYEAA